MPLQPNQLLNNRYHILTALGAGGMGSVYRAMDQSLNRNVAIKERTPDPNATPAAIQQARIQFQREAQVLANLNHPNLPRVSDYFSFSGNEYLVMDLVEGQNLHSIAQQYGMLAEAPVLVWTNQMLDALAYIHARGVIHRDIKPQNIILTPDGRAMLVDFGLVKLIDPNNPYTLTAMRGMGTAEYAPIEQYATGASHTDARSDIFSFGATLYHLLTGHPPADVHQRILNPAVLATPRTINATVSSRTEWIVLKAIEIQPPSRFQSALEMRQALTAQPTAQTPQVPVNVAPLQPVTLPPAPRYANPPQTQITTPPGMILIPAGEFMMGSNERGDEKPLHLVYLDAFYMDRYPVTNTEYKKFVEARKYRSPKHWKNGRIPNGKENHPIVYVSWDDANAFAHWAGKRLPTEAEWEKTARGTDGRIYPWGNPFDVSRCNSSESNIGDTAPVGKYSPGGDSPYGVGDMVGNVLEWCADWYGSYPSGTQRNPTGPSSGQYRILRGGAWSFASSGVRAAYRFNYNPSSLSSDLGFRCARSP